MKIKLLSKLSLASALFVSGGLQAEFVPVINAGLGGGYAATSGSTPSALGLFNLYAVPAYRTGRLTLLPTLYSSMGAQERSIEEGTVFVRTVEAGFAPTFKLKQGAFRSASLRLEMLHAWNLETANESWGKGLYDYEQFGAGLAYEFPSELLKALASVGINFSHRSYPNYRNVQAASALLNDKDYYYKDFYATSLEFKADLVPLGIHLSYSPEYRAYTDSYVVREDGQTDLGALQADWLHRLKLNGAKPFGKSWGLLYGLDLRLNSSNQNYFDSLAARPTYVAGYGNYSSETLSLTLPWIASSLMPGLTLSPGYDLTLLQSAKPVQTSDGAYTDDKQSIMDNNFRLNIEKAFASGLAWDFDGGYRISRSNQQLVRGLQNNYEYWQLTTGLKYTFKGE